MKYAAIAASAPFANQMHRSRKRPFPHPSDMATLRPQLPPELIMTGRLAPIYSAAWRAAIVLLTVQISVDSTLRYITNSQPGPEPVVANAFATPFLVLHVIGAMTALLVGPLQFVRAVRTRWPAFHRMTGRIYILGCAIGAPTGFILAWGTTAGPVAAIGFAIPAVLWPAFTWLGLRAAVERRVDDHRDWMLRSYALIASAITLRLMLPAALMAGYEFFPAYRVISWLTWTTNLALCEYFIRRNRASVTGRARFATV